jgi:SOS-response transcriptional repressor LexA
MEPGSKKHILEEIQRFIDETDSSMRAISLEAGLGEGAVRDLFRKPKVMPTIETVGKLATAMGMEPAELAGWSRRRLPGRRRAGGMKVIGEVAAGMWHDLSGVDEPPNQDHDVPFHGRYDQEAQYGLLVRGTSINKIAAPGDILQCVDVGISGIAAQHDDLVIVERRRAQAGQKEVTAKRFRRRRDGVVELWPESTDEKWSTPLVLDPKAAPDGDEVAVIAVVVAVYKPLRRN